MFHLRNLCLKVVQIFYYIFFSSEFANFFFFPLKSLVCLKVNVYGMKLNVTFFISVIFSSFSYLGNISNLPPSLSLSTLVLRQAVSVPSSKHMGCIYSFQHPNLATGIFRQFTFKSSHCCLHFSSPLSTQSK